MPKITATSKFWMLCLFRGLSHLCLLRKSFSQMDILMQTRYHIQRQYVHNFLKYIHKTRKWATSFVSIFFHIEIQHWKQSNCGVWVEICAGWTRYRTEKNTHLHKFVQVYKNHKEVNRSIADFLVLMLTWSKWGRLGQCMNRIGVKIR